MHKREENKDSCTYKKTGPGRTPKDSFIFKGNILTLPHEVKTPRKKQLPDAVILRCAASESLPPAHKYYSREEKTAFSHAMVPLPATKFLQWCQKISVVFLHNPMIVNLMPKLHQLLLLFCPATLNRNGML